MKKAPPPVADDDEYTHWHDFAALAMRIDYEMYDQTGQLVFETEYEFGKQPPIADIIIVKKDDDLVIERGIARLFRRVNIVEYKSPHDSLTVNDFYKVFAYACLYLDKNYGDGTRLGLDDLTVSLLVTRRPRKLFAHLAEKGFSAEERETGIHVIGGVPCAAQIVETRRLKGTDILLKSLRDDLTLEEAAALADGAAGRTSRFLGGYMERLIDLNPAVFKEVNQMGKGFDRFLEETGLKDKWRNEGVEIGVAKGMEKGAENAANYVLSLMRQGYSADKIEQMLREKKSQRHG
jgi:hypothetical protein